ncbi:hypothetical protein [Burkholderia sp. Ac-20353]|uniref:hypothetical protein n=1 Tax=Burkholderia sp. Ac-20353 TaxID=2703894 RepID=UPI00197C294D|nr:hypothetical protein [Burkholderia sp. Ac-20353]MBN3788748.1 hypothetical protein [Burkholderia sp. Ac-20353]
MASQTPALSTPSPCAHRTRTLHSDRDLYLICRNEPKPGNENWATVVCEQDDRGKAIGAYISPFDAMIDARLQQSDSRLYRVLPSTSFDVGNFINDHNNQLAVSFQIAWIANNGHILLRPSGRFTACSIIERSRIDDGQNSIHFAIPKLASEMHARLLDIAGASSWQDSIDEFKSLPTLQREKLVTEAIQKIPGTRSGDHQHNELAFYELNKKQWRFIPLPLFDDLFIKNEAEINDKNQS